MRLLYINPNSSAVMTAGIVAAARAAAPGAEVLGWTNEAGPPAIQGQADGALAVVGLMALLPAARKVAADVIITACFDDVGLDALRRTAHCPVLGLGQASYMMAGLLGQSFSVVTTLPVSVPVIEDNIRRLGFGPACASVRASGLAVLEVEQGGEAVHQRLSDEITLARQRDGASAVVLGCAGMAPLRAELERRSGATLIEGVDASARLALAAAGYRAGLSRRPVVLPA